MSKVLKLGGNTNLVWGFLKGTVLQLVFSRRVVTVALGIFEIFSEKNSHLSLYPCPAKSWSNADFAPQNQSLRSLLRKIMET